MVKQATRTRRSPQQMIADLQKEIERIKTRAAQAKVKKDPALKHISGAVRSIDKAVTATGDTATRQALGEARATLAACLSLNGAVMPKASRGSRASTGPAPDPQAVLDYLGKHPGSSGEAIAEALGTDTATLRPVVKKLVEAKQVKAKGQARGTRYAAG